MDIIYSNDNGDVVSYAKVGYLKAPEGFSRLEWEGETPEPPQDYRVSDGQVISKLDTEIQSIRDQHQEAYVRAERDKLLFSTVDTLNGPRWSSLTAEEQAEWVVYRQALLDVPQQEDLYNISWPIVPE